MFSKEIVGVVLYGLGLSMVGIAAIVSIISYIFSVTIHIAVLYMFPVGLALALAGVIILFVDMFRL